MSLGSPHDPYQALRFRDYRLLLIGNFIAALGMHMLNIAIGWELYERTDSALALGIVGLVQVLPILSLALITGTVADQYSRKRIVIFAQLAIAAASLGLAAASYLQAPLLFIYGSLLVIGTGTAFNLPAVRTLPAEIVPDEAFENSATWSTSFSQLAAVLGPSIGGIIIAIFHTTAFAYLFCAMGALSFVVLLLFVKEGQAAARRAQRREPLSLHALGEGISFLRRTHIILAAITLDMFAVLLGGATTLLPIFARDILMVGPSGMGWLRAAPSVGAVAMAVYLAHRPPLQRAGPTLLLSVIGFGAVTIVFGLSQLFWLSMLALVALGALDNISVVIRSTLILTRTPNEMRGRVSAINSLFIGASNQLGGFESGLTAQLFGPILSVVGGGVGTILVVLLIAFRWPDLRHLRTLREEAAKATMA